MAASDMMSALMELCQEKHIDQLYLIDRLEQSLAKSYAEILHLEWGAKVTLSPTKRAKSRGRRSGRAMPGLDTSSV